MGASDADAAIPAALRQRGGSTYGMRARRLVLSLHGAEHELGAVADMPLSLAGAAGFNIENLAAAALTAALLGWPLDAVRETAGLKRFAQGCPTGQPARASRPRARPPAAAPVNLSAPAPTSGAATLASRAAP